MEYRFLPAAEPLSAFTMIAERVDEQEYFPDHRDGFFYIRVNDTGKNFRVVKTSVGTPGREGWVEVLAEDKAAPLEDFDLFAGFAVGTRRVAGLPVLEVMSLDDLAAVRRIRSPILRTTQVEASIRISVAPSTGTATSHWRCRVRCMSTTWLPQLARRC